MAIFVKVPRQQLEMIDVSKDSRTIEELLRMLTLDDIFVIIIVKCLRDGKTWANYQSLREFFADLRDDPKDWATDQVRKILNEITYEDVDHMMTRVMGLSGLVSYVAAVGNDYCYMNENQARRALKYYDRLNKADQRTLDVIVERYSRLLEDLGR